MDIPSSASQTSVPGDDAAIRCAWCTDDPLYIHYHDHEWGVPSYDAGHLFEMLILEGFQAGLSWITILRKREAFREALASFDPHVLAATTPDWVAQHMQNPAIIRNRLKLQATGKNARAWLALKDPVDLVWSAVGGQPQVHHYAHTTEIPTAGPEAQALSKLLKRHGFTFVGPTICQSYLQAIGALMDHTTSCFRHAMLDTPPQR
ncbi:DNA-3-methyladenine glycosylase I [Castellaniella sp.]|jgi:DNA-3-methyladenine glycosylase I|uniref:DNA-3-methyladenine glycosylase I n=1 Tax=Castellaniella sp. TaxID=1955812 RepID=UPI003A8D9976